MEILVVSYDFISNQTLTSLQERANFAKERTTVIGRPR